jgi:hypothetical protein
LLRCDEGYVSDRDYNSLANAFTRPNKLLQYLGKDHLIVIKQPENDTPAESNNTDSPEAQLQRINLELAKAQLQKLNLEIEDLKPKSKWTREVVVRAITIVTAVSAIVSFSWGVYVYEKQQEKDRQTREDDRKSRDLMQYRASYEQLLQFSSSPNMTVQTVLFLRNDIDHLIDSIYPPDKQEDERARLKRNIYSLITKDCDFTQTRHVQLDIAALEEWKDYEKDLKETPNKIYINKYIHAIQYLHTRDAKYIESVTYTPEIGYREIQAPTEPLSNSFGSLVEGFRLHLKLIGKKERDEAVQDFAIVTNNPTLTADLFPPEAGTLLE